MLGADQCQKLPSAGLRSADERGERNVASVVERNRVVVLVPPAGIGGEGSLEVALPRAGGDHPVSRTLEALLDSLSGSAHMTLGIVGATLDIGGWGGHLGKKE